ncbi:M56 family metallopeptidase [Candidatus Palauibacter sp.]|uniref:M56 family metallopeptidase n=1 Tax=Candidatus Palauibacter sp. TaxID=3101350 RepID=UPI003B01512A
MTDLILQIGASKLVLSVGLAGVAWIVQRRLGWPSLAHGLWLLPLAALLVPPLVSIPIWPREADPVAAVAAAGLSGAEPTPLAGAILVGWLKSHGKEGLVWLWLLGTASVLGWTLVRTLRFHRSLVRASEVAPPSVQRTAQEIARNLGLGAVPTVYATPAHVSPMVWWAGGKTRILLPSPLLAAMDGVELRCILAHELAHVRRRDRVVRWLEWLACAAFWWNPVAWWARRRLRASEELCCDALAITALDGAPRMYAGALLRVIDFMSTTPAPGPLTFASTIDRCGRASRLEKRFRVIMTNRRPPETPRWLRVTLRCGAVCLLAGGLTYCTDQAELTSIDPALAPPVQETVFLDTGGERPIANPPLVVDGDSLFLAAELSREEVVLRALAARTEMLAVERELRPIQLLQVLRQPGHGGADGLDVLTPTPADLFVLTPDHGTGDWSAEAVEAALVRYQLVRESALAARREATYLECEIEGKSVSGGELTSVSGTCETVETNERKRTPRK